MRRPAQLLSLLLGALVALCLTLAAPAPALAEDAITPPDIAAMDVKGLESLVGFLTTSVGQDSLKLRTLAGAQSCLELLRAANSFDLAYGYLAQVTDRAKALGADASAVAVRTAQSRVLVFAARVRAAEFLARGCGGYQVAADMATDPRYKTPPVIADSEFARALIEARQAAEANLGATIFAARNRQCERVASSLESVSLLVPYLDKLLADVAQRPYALGPRASRRGLSQTRNQLVATANRVAAEFDGACRAAERTAPPAPAAPDAAPVSP